MTFETQHHKTDDDERVLFARNGGDHDIGLDFPVKTTLPKDLYDLFVMACHARGGQSAVLRDFVTIFVKGVTYAEHVAQRRREVLFGPGQETDPFKAIRGGQA